MNTIGSKLIGWPGALTAGFLLCMVLALHFKNNASTGVLGTDESLYIFLAHGQNEPSQLAQPISSLGVALEKSLRRTGDPVGFFVLLHYWEHISMNEAWLRLLPFLFYIIGIICLIGIGRLLRLPPLLCVLGGALPFGSRNFNLYAFELRGYGLEVCVAFIVLFCGIWIIRYWIEEKAVSAPQWIALTIVAMLGFTTRVSFAITCGALYTTLWILIFIRPRLRRDVVPLLISSLAVMTALAGMVWLIFHYANGVVNVSADQYVINGSSLHKIRVLLVELTYLPVALFSGAGVTHAPLFLKALFIFAAGSTTIAVFSLVFRLIIGVKIDTVAFWKRFPLQLCVLVYIVIMLFYTLVLAWLGIHPFVVMSRWGLFMQPALYVVILAVLSIAFSRKIEHRIDRVVRQIGVVALLVTVIVYGTLYARYRITMRGGGSHYTEKLISNLVPRDKLVTVKWWYLNNGESFPFLYLMQYGKMKQTCSGSAQFKFESFSNATVDRNDLEAIFREMAIGDTVMMLLSHIDSQGRDRYQLVFSHLFPNFQSGPWIDNDQQAYLGIKQ